MEKRVSSFGTLKTCFCLTALGFPRTFAGEEGGTLHSPELVWECSFSIDCKCGDLQNPNTSWAEFGPGKDLKTKYSDILVDSNVARLEFWNDICAQYSARQLTFPSDRLPALSSVAKRIDYPGMCRAYLAGIREDSLSHGLFWWSEFTNPKFYPLGAKTRRRDKNHQIPTWSWLSIEGRVSTWGMSQACFIVVEILIVHYIPAKDGDDYGPCGEGIITLSSSGVPTEVVEAKLPDGPSNMPTRKFSLWGAKNYTISILTRILSNTQHKT